jgi:hypothetical protein
LKAAAKKLVNGPSAYRGADFGRWRKDTVELYAELNKLGLSAVFEDRLRKRGFGRCQGVLTETQIYAAFKTDMNATIADFRRIILNLQKRNTNPNPSCDLAETVAQFGLLALLTPKLAVGFVVALLTLAIAIVAIAFW